MKQFIALVHKDEGSAYGVIFPDLPGCFSAADDYSDLVKNAAEALALWFEDEALVEPRGIEAIRAEVAEDLAEGAFLVAVPYVKRTTAMKRVNISMDTGTLDAIDQAASDMGLSRSAFLALAAQNQIEAAR